MSTPLPDWPFLRLQKDRAVVVDVHVMPNAARTRIQGLHDGALRVLLQAPPVDGKANLALQAWLAEQLGIARAAVELLRGDTARRKQLRVAAPQVAQACWQHLRPPAG